MLEIFKGEFVADFCQQNPEKISCVETIPGMGEIIDNSNCINFVSPWSVNVSYININIHDCSLQSRTRYHSEYVTCVTLH